MQALNKCLIPPACDLTLKYVESPMNLGKANDLAIHQINYFLFMYAIFHCLKLIKLPKFSIFKEIVSYETDIFIYF